MEQFQPDWASAPGETIRDILFARGISMLDFARQIRQTPDQVAELLEGRTAITLGVARLLEEVLGPSTAFWMARDYQYRADVQRIHGVEREWLSELPLTDMVKFGWIKPPPLPAEEVTACLKFFAVPSVAAWTFKYGDLRQMAMFRTSASFDSRPAAVAAWLRQGEIMSEQIDCGPWDPERLRHSIPTLRALTRRKDPAQFLAELQTICGESGVAVVALRAPSGCRASGATCFLPSGRALLLCSFRYLSDDQFWFSFFHEVGHLLLHGELGFFLEGSDSGETREEREANEFARDALVPPPANNTLATMQVSHQSVLRLARSIGVSPGILVGQLQHLKRIPYSDLNGLKRRYTWPE